MGMVGCQSGDARAKARPDDPRERAPNRVQLLDSVQFDDASRSRRAAIGSPHFLSIVSSQIQCCRYRLPIDMTITDIRPSRWGPPRSALSVSWTMSQASPWCP
jgi:hypothetical protein